MKKNALILMILMMLILGLLPRTAEAVSRGVLGVLIPDAVSLQMTPALSRAISRETFFQPVCFHDAPDALESVLARELEAARDDYYHFRFDQAAAKVSGRSDQAALKLAALIAFSSGDETRAEVLCERLLSLYPRSHFDAPEDAPRLTSLLETVRRKKNWVGQASALETQRSPWMPFAGEESGWRERFRLLSESMGWEGVLVVSLEPIGWNQKLAFHYFPRHATGRWLTSQIVEIKSLSDLSKGARAGLRRIFSIDSIGASKVSNSSK